MGLKSAAISAALSIVVAILLLTPAAFAANKNASTPTCSGSSCRQTAGSGKQQASAQASPSKKQSATKKVCSSIAGILKREIGGTKNKTKLGILRGGLKYADEVCGRGGIPDLARLTKGLPEQDKLRISQRTGAALFDGAASRSSKDFTAAFKPAVALAAGGSIANLKSSDPDIKKTSPATEFSLQKKPAVLLAAASDNPYFSKIQSAGSPDDTCDELKAKLEKLETERFSFDEYVKSLSRNPIGEWCFYGDKRSASGFVSMCYSQREYTSMLELLREFDERIKTTKSLYEKKCVPCKEGKERVGNDCVPKCTGGQVRNADTKCVKPCPDGKTAPDSKGNCPCGAAAYNPKDSCCSADKKVHQGQTPDKKGGCAPKEKKAEEPAKEEKKPEQTEPPEIKSNVLGVELARQYLSEAGGNAELALKNAQQARLARDWESKTPEGDTLRNAENYLTAYWAVSKKQLGPSWLTYMFYVTVGIPGWQAWHAGIDTYNWGTTNIGAFKWMRKFWDPAENDPASFSALAAGYAGANDAIRGLTWPSKK